MSAVVSTTELRVEAILWNAFIEARQIRCQQPGECCSCGAVTDYGCTVPLGDGTERFACQGCNADPVCWPDGDDGPFRPKEARS